MSGSAGAPRIKSRADFAQFLSSYQKLIKKFPGFESIQPSGSYNSNPNKQDFGDIDLITHIASDQDKHTVKKQLEQFFLSQPDSVIVPFESARYRGRRADCGWPGSCFHGRRPDHARCGQRAALSNLSERYLTQCD